MEKQNDYFPKAEDFRVSKSPEIRFMPQATIQYPIEYSIPLFFSLFDFYNFFSVEVYLLLIPNSASFYRVFAVAHHIVKRLHTYFQFQLFAEVIVHAAVVNIA